MKKFKMYYQGLRSSNKIGGKFYKNKRFGVIEYDEENIEDADRLAQLLEMISKEHEFKCTTPDCGFACVEVSDVEEFYEFRNIFRDLEKKIRYYDPEYDRFTDEEYIRKQYDYFFNEASWFTKSYEEFLSENFRVVC